jgi:ADP-ribose pyrophosphatase YjhB (NUDIX family)
MRINTARIAFLLKEAWSRVARPVMLGVRIILVQDGNVLLVRHTYMEGWHFRHETPLEAAAREANEEAGAELLEPPELLGIFTSYNVGRSDHVAVYVCRSFRLTGAIDRWEIAECKLLAVDAMPPQVGDKWFKIVADLAKANGQHLKG